MQRTPVFFIHAAAEDEYARYVQLVIGKILRDHARLFRHKAIAQQRADAFHLRRIILYARVKHTLEHLGFCAEGRVHARHVLKDFFFQLRIDGVGKRANDSLHPRFLGENVALVGPSGGGKTTLCNLIPRFYDVTGGKILIDGQDVRSVTLRSLREAIGVVQQDVYLFSGTVAENIAYGRPGATRAEIEEAARLAGADGFVRALKNGYDTYVGERGVKLSGGQKQRLAIARVFLKNPRILLLDEATSALDNESEILVGQSLDKLAKGRTTLTIAHRLTTIQNADRILVLGRDGIEEEGSHEALLAKQGVYYRLWNGLVSGETL